MKVFMLGWEFAPIKSGGLGVACKGITDGLQDHGVDITFVMPSSFHSAWELRSKEEGISSKSLKVVSKQLKTVKIRSSFSFIHSPYSGLPVEDFSMTDLPHHEPKSHSPKTLYGDNFFAEIEKFNEEVEALALDHQHDVIHAHDWMTFEAGNRVKKRSKKPFIAHVHATEIDRTAGFPHPYIFHKEQEGLKQADHIIVVSFYTKKILEHYYGIPAHKISVVHNAAKVHDADSLVKEHHINPHFKAKDRIVLFLGRITIQKGPEQFVEIAQKVLEKRKDVKFVIAGHGDMLPQIVQKIAENHIQENVFMSGYLTGEALKRALYHADIYIMPSVSEPFGISALEAVEYDIPVIMSKTSGAQEVIKNSLCADFWDTKKMANQVIALLDYPILRETLIREAKQETKYLTWKEQAKKIKNLYSSLIQK